MTSTTPRLVSILNILFLGAIAVAAGACASPAVQECGATGVLCPQGTHCAAAQGICLPDTNTCGDAHLDPGEVCDDGNTVDGDGCSHDCLSIETCGNGFRDVLFKDPTKNEVCDDGNTVDGDGCSHDCLSLEKCGDGHLNIHEECDDGNIDPGDGCSAKCTIERCGNGILDPGEACDLLPVDTTRCSADCKSTRMCGNGIVDPGEECDLGGLNSNSGDCRADCVFNRCGDGFKNTLGSAGHPEHIEACDDAPQAAAFSRVVKPTETAACNIDCTPAACGDGKVNPHNLTAPATSVGEQCDDKNAVNGDGCDNNCTFTACGNGIVTAGEQCDDGNLADNDGCDHNCKMPGCGNGVINGTEQCDDGNLIDGDGCDRNCKVTRCGNGIMTAGEECDDGNTTNGDGCSSTCKMERCGNGIVDPNEECDQGAANSDTGDCRTDCVLNRCGDGHVNLSVGAGQEQCDGGPLAPMGSLVAIPTETSTCNIDCTTPSCGDGKVNKHFGEECDNAAGNGINNDCTDACKKNVCGDGKKDTQGPVTEQCDDGNNMNGDGCSSTCRLETCGNGIVDSGEECDNGGSNNDNGDCRTDCVINRCGDGHPNTLGTNVEQCDGGPVAGAGIRTAIPTDTPNCNSNCKLPTCGDGYVNRSYVVPMTTLTEQCDPPGPGCSATCRLENCGNGVMDPGEQCDDGNTSNGDGCENDCTLPRCGNGIKDGIEECDDGNSINSDDCTNACKTAKCGDGLVRSTPLDPLNKEDCDDPTLPTSCAYIATQTPCNVCNNMCKSVPGTAQFCGDGIMQSQEVCDGGMRGCGACSADCTTVISQAATGLILAPPGSAVAASDNFIMGDGATSVTFELTTTGTRMVPSSVLIMIVGGATPDSAAVVAGKIATAVHGALHINTSLVGSAVVLTHQRSTQLGNVPIVNHVMSTMFATDGMNGGQGGRCLGSAPCTGNLECESNMCVSGMCAAP